MVVVVIVPVLIDEDVLVFELTELNYVIEDVVATSDKDNTEGLLSTISTFAPHVV